MPSSHHKQLDDIIDLILITKPESLLDIGIGFGKYGFLAREYLELWDGDRNTDRKKYKEWKVRIDGIEAFEDYRNPIYDFIYDHVYFGDALKILPKIEKRYDLILLIDVLEHFSYRDGTKILNECKRRARNVIVSTPKDVGPQKDVFGNIYEIHKFQWKKEHFSMFPKRFFVPNRRSLIAYLGDDALSVESFRLHAEIYGRFPFLSPHVLKIKVKQQFPVLIRPYKLIKDLFGRHDN